MYNILVADYFETDIKVHYKSENIICFLCFVYRVLAFNVPKSLFICFISVDCSSHTYLLNNKGVGMKELYIQSW